MDAISIDQYFPSVLRNFIKIISKILVGRLGDIVSRIVSHNQFDFLWDRHIEDCIAIWKSF